MAISLTERLNKEIKNRKFNILEMTGFKSDPNLALLAGAAIGYQLGIDAFKEFLDKYNNSG